MDCMIRGRREKWNEFHLIDIDLDINNKPQPMMSLNEGYNLYKRPIHHQKDQSKNYKNKDRKSVLVAMSEADDHLAWIDGLTSAEDATTVMLMTGPLTNIELLRPPLLVVSVCVPLSLLT
jgi:hypothetical protein